MNIADDPNFIPQSMIDAPPPTNRVRPRPVAAQPVGPTVEDIEEPAASTQAPEAAAEGFFSRTGRMLRELAGRNPWELSPRQRSAVAGWRAEERQKTLDAEHAAEAAAAPAAPQQRGIATFVDLGTRQVADQRRRERERLEIPSTAQVRADLDDAEHDLAAGDLQLTTAREAVAELDSKTAKARASLAAVREQITTLERDIGAAETDYRLKVLEAAARGEVPPMTSITQNEAEFSRAAALRSVEQLEQLIVEHERERGEAASEVARLEAARRIDEFRLTRAKALLALVPAINGLLAVESLIDEAEAAGRACGSGQAANIARRETRPLRELIAFELRTLLPSWPDLRAIL